MKKYLIAFAVTAILAAAVLAFYGEPEYWEAVVAFGKALWAYLGDILVILWEVLLAFGKLCFALLPEPWISIPSLLVVAAMYVWGRR